MTELLTAFEASQRLRVTYGTLAVWRCTHRKALPFVRIGRKIYYRPQDLEAFITANLHPGDGPLPQVPRRKRGAR
jgi:excisionase family DNA binding protein